MLSMSTLGTAYAGVAVLDKEITDVHPFILGSLGTSDECDGEPAIEIKVTPLFCVIKISYDGNGVNAIIEDTIPAGWEVLFVFDENFSNICDFGQANKGAKPNRSATKITCEETDKQMYWIFMTNRETPNGKFLKPTSCSEDFPLNDGAVAFLSLAGEKVLELGLPIIVANSELLEPLPTFDSNDLDCDGINNEDEILGCEEDPDPFCTGNG